MLNKMFSKNKPIGYLVLGLSLLLFYFVYLSSDVKWIFGFQDLLNKIGGFLLLVSSLLTIQYFSIKNKMHTNLYGLFFFICFLLFMVRCFDDIRVISANFLVLLAFLKIYSLETNQLTKKNIFDACVLVFLAALLEPWCLLYMVLIYRNIFWYNSFDYRNWLVPFVVLAFFGIIVLAFWMFSPEYVNEFFTDFLDYSFDFKYFGTDVDRLVLSVFTSFVLQIFIGQLMVFKHLHKYFISKYNMLIMYLIISIFVYVLSKNKSNSLFLFTLFPLSIFAGNIMLNVKKKWVREFVLWFVLVLCLVFYFLQL